MFTQSMVQLMTVPVYFLVTVREIMNATFTIDHVDHAQARAK